MGCSRVALAARHSLRQSKPAARHHRLGSPASEVSIPPGRLTASGTNGGKCRIVTQPFCSRNDFLDSIPVPPKVSGQPSRVRPRAGRRRFPGFVIDTSANLQTEPRKYFSPIGNLSNIDIDPPLAGYPCPFSYDPVSGHPTLHADPPHHARATGTCRGS